MNLVSVYIRNWLRDVGRAWDQFWFTPTDPATLCLIRVLAGAMLLYTHFVWTIDLEGFFGEQGRLPLEFTYRFHDSPFAWSHLYWFEGTSLWVVHVIALAVFFAMMVGFQTRWAALLSFLLTVSYAHRASGALYGLDQINAYLAMYLMLGPSGADYSIDRWLQRRSGAGVVRKSIAANVAIRLMQLHLCVIYLFAGTGKLLGESWWDGTALWGAFGNFEYQTIDMSWVAHSILVVNILTHVTLAWEVSYAALIWPRMTRPVMLLLAVPLHLGIALCMGMITFGVIMIVANMAFLPPEFVRWLQNLVSPKGSQAVGFMSETSEGTSAVGANPGPANPGPANPGPANPGPANQIRSRPARTPRRNKATPAKRVSR